MTVAEFFRRTNAYRLSQGLAPLEGLHKYRSQIADFLNWCRDNQVDPYLFWLARTEAAGYPKRFKGLASAKFLSEFREWGEARQRAQERDRQANLQAWSTTLAKNPLRPGMSPFFIDGLRRAFAGDREFCALHPDTFPDPDSRECDGCPLADACMAGEYGDPERTRKALESP